MLWGLPDRHCLVVGDPPDSAALLDPVHRAAEEATDTLLVYYAGHGLRDVDSADLYLSLTGSRAQHRVHGCGLRASARCRTAVQARCKIVVLDCCFSGRAALTLSGADLADQAAVDGAYALAAAPRDRVALAPDGEMHTAFTGELLDLLRLGIEGGPELIDLETIDQVLDVRLRAKNRPRPQRSQENHSGRLPLVRNLGRATRPGAGRAGAA